MHWRSAIVALGLGWALAGGARGGAASGLLVANGAVELAAGPVGAGQVLLTLPVRHARVGWLANRITMDSVFGRDPPLEVGQPMFAVPMEDGRTAWCAPRPAAGASAYRTTCLTPSHAGLYEWEIRRSPALAPSDLGQVNMGTSGQASDAPVVRPGHVRLPPMTLSVTLKDVSPDGRACDLDIAIDWGEGPAIYDHQAVALSGRGGVARIMGRALKLSPGPQAGQVRVRRAWF